VADHMGVNSAVDHIGSQLTIIVGWPRC